MVDASESKPTGRPISYSEISPSIEVFPNARHLTAKKAERETDRREIEGERNSDRRADKQRRLALQ